MPATTLVPDGGDPSYAYLSDALDSSYVSIDSANTSRAYELSNCPGDLTTVTDVEIRLRIALNLGGSSSEFSAVQIFKADGLTPLTSAGTGPSLSTTITDYLFYPSSIYSTDKATWDGAKLKITGTPASTGFNIYEASVGLTYTSSGAYSLSADPGSYIVTGTSSALRRSVISAEPGTYSVSNPHPANFIRGFNTEPGSYTATGGTQEFRYLRIFRPESGSYSVAAPTTGLIRTPYITSTGGVYAATDVGVTFVVGPRDMAARAGMYTTATPSADLIYARAAMPVDAGSYTQTGIAATFRHDYWLTAIPIGSYFTSGQPPWLKRQKKITAEAGSYAHSAPAETRLRIPIPFAVAGGTYTASGTTGLRATRRLTLATGAYAQAGPAATIYISNRYLSAMTANTAVTGIAASLLAQHKLAIGSGSFTVTGGSVTLSVAEAIEAIVFTAAAGSYASTGYAAELKHNFIFIAGAGSYSATGSETSPRSTRSLTVGASSYTTTFTPFTTTTGRKIVAATSSTAVTGTAVTMQLQAKLSADGGAHSVTGIAITTTRNLKISVSGSYSIKSPEMLFVKTPKIAVDAGIYSLAAGVTSCARQLVATAFSGNYAASGPASGLLRATICRTDVGAFKITGTAAELTSSRLLTAASGGYNTAFPVSTVTVSYVIEADSSDYAVTGTDTEFVIPRRTALIIGTQCGCNC